MAPFAPLLCLALLLTELTSDPQDVRTLIDRLRSKPSIAQCDQLLSREDLSKSQRSEVWTTRGIPRADAEELEPALADFQAAVEVYPESISAREQLGITLTKLGRPAEAVPELARVAATEYAPHRVHLALAQAHFLLEDWDQALVSLNNFVDNPWRGDGTGVGLTLRGFVQSQRGSLLRAIEDLDRAIEIGYEGPEAVTLRTDLLADFDAKDHEALDQFRAARKDHDQALPFIQVARHFQLTGRFEVACEALEIAQDRGLFYDASIRRERALVEYQVGHFGQAAVLLRAATAGDYETPGEPDLFLGSLHYRALCRLGQEPAGRAALQALLDAHAETAPAWDVALAKYVLGGHKPTPHGIGDRPDAMTAADRELDLAVLELEPRCDPGSPGIRAILRDDEPYNRTSLAYEYQAVYQNHEHEFDLPTTGPLSRVEYTRLEYRAQRSFGGRSLPFARALLEGAAQPTDWTLQQLVDASPDHVELLLPPRRFELEHALSLYDRHHLTLRGSEDTELVRRRGAMTVSLERCSNLTLLGLRIRLEADDSDYSPFENGSLWGALYANGVDGLLVEGCDLSSAGSSGFRCSFGSGTVLRGNRIHDCTEHGLRIQEANGLTLEGNVLTNNARRSWVGLSAGELTRSGNLEDGEPLDLELP